MKKEMKSKVNKKVLVISLVLLAFVVINVMPVHAFFGLDDSSFSPDSFWGRWFTKTVTGADAKVILLIMVVVVLYVLLSSMGMGTFKALLIAIPLSFVLTVYVTPESVLQIFRTYDTLPLTIIAVLPLIILLGFTYLSVAKGKRELMAMQLVLWMVFTALTAVKVLYLWFGTGTLFSPIFEMYLSTPPSTELLSPYAVTLYIQLTIGLLMSLGNGFFLKWAMERTLGIENAAAYRSTSDVKTAIKDLGEIAKTLQGKSP